VHYRSLNCRCTTTCDQIFLWYDNIRHRVERYLLECKSWSKGQKVQQKIYWKCNQCRTMQPCTEQWRPCVQLEQW
jgi:hypothetical protein